MTSASSMPSTPATKPAPARLSANFGTRSPARRTCAPSAFASPYAIYMAEVFNRAGIASVAVSGQTDDAERALALQQLRFREINCIFAVDLFNEGLDLPEVDTILLL